MTVNQFKKLPRSKQREIIKKLEDKLGEKDPVTGEEDPQVEETLLKLWPIYGYEGRGIEAD